MTAHDDPAAAASERTIARRRLISGVIAVLAMGGIAGGSAVAAVVGAPAERAQTSATSVSQVDAS